MIRPAGMPAFPIVGNAVLGLVFIWGGQRPDSKGGLYRAGLRTGCASPDREAAGDLCWPPVWRAKGHIRNFTSSLSPEWAGKQPVPDCDPQRMRGRRPSPPSAKGNPQMDSRRTWPEGERNNLRSPGPSVPDVAMGLAMPFTGGRPRAWGGGTGEAPIPNPWRQPYLVAGVLNGLPDGPGLAALLSGFTPFPHKPYRCWRPSRALSTRAAALFHAKTSTRRRCGNRF